MNQAVIDWHEFTIIKSRTIRCILWHLVIDAVHKNEVIINKSIVKWLRKLHSVIRSYSMCELV